MIGFSETAPASSTAETGDSKLFDGEFNSLSERNLTNKADGL